MADSSKLQVKLFVVVGVAASLISV